MELGHQINALFVNEFILDASCSNCHIQALFSNRHKLASNSPSLWIGVVAPHLFSQQLSMASCTRNVLMAVHLFILVRALCVHLCVCVEGENPTVSGLQ